jgi:hypothetical protein
MFASAYGVPANTPGFSMARNFRFSDFAPRLYNYCTQKLGMKRGLIMPSRAFCSDGSQGYPIILLTKHFGTFPFDFGLIGGQLSFERSPAFVAHGRDLVIVQATHVGFDAEARTYGTYPRHRTAIDPAQMYQSGNCGHVAAILQPYSKAFKSAAASTLARKDPVTGQIQLYVRNYWLEPPASRLRVRAALDYPRMLRHDAKTGASFSVSTDPVARTLVASDEFAQYLTARGFFTGAAQAQKSSNGFAPLSDALTADWFKFELGGEQASAGSGGCCGPAKPQMSDYEAALSDVMPWVVTQKHPMLAAAQACAQVEFHNFLRELYFSKSMYGDRNLIYISGVNIDVAPPRGSPVGTADAFFPRTLFVPWAAYAQRPDGTGKVTKEVWSQERVFEELASVSNVNAHQLELDAAASKLPSAPEINLAV